MKKKAVALIVFLFVIIVACAVFCQWENAKKTEITKQTVIQQQEEEAKRLEEEIKTIENLINITSEISIPSVDTNSWKIYKNDNYKFEMKMPIDWYVDNTKEKWLCLKSKSRRFYYEGESNICGISINIGYLSDYAGSEENLVSSLEKLQERGVITEMDNVFIDNRKGLYFKGVTAPTVLIKNKDVIWGIQIQAAESIFVNNNVQDVFWGIIETFHFIN